MSQRRSQGGASTGQTAIALTVLGVSSALFGALVVGPALGKRTPPPDGRRQVASAPRLGSQPPSSGTRATASEPKDREPNVPEEGEHLANQPGDLGPAPDSEDPDRETVAPDNSTEADATNPGSAEKTAAEKVPAAGHREGGDATDEQRPPKRLTDEKPKTGSERDPAERPKPSAKERDRDRSDRMVAQAAIERQHRLDRGARDTAEVPNKTGTREPGDAPQTLDHGSTAKKRPADTDRRRTGETTAAAEKKPAEPKKTAGSTTKTPAPEPSKPKEAAGKKEPATKSEPDSTDLPLSTYKVRVGQFNSRDEATKFRDELFNKTGNNAFLVKVGESYRVQVGVYRQKQSADRMAEALRAHSYQAEVTKN
jgi:hypothetical protein